ncbi:sarcosine oxidase subunit alpha [Thalassobacillus cyri]|uniref:Sarcosine oxidase subunit alpha n=1 Tax=Thalassobacillus cyri TaxID=571932 RepID=A0A1H3VZL7_9BACI|nr:(2Fe-2S)-binding protein [Thalassobacillus cyri]SDZ80180.1 sarcosine oxidase subunit alpha [Thalassobacillus cyri]
MEFIKDHSILQNTQNEKVTFFYEGTPLHTRKGTTVAAALMENGIKKLGVSRKLNQSRGYFCGIGRCCSCFVTINGEEHVRSCMVTVEESMEVQPNLQDPNVRSSSNEY